MSVNPRGIIPGDQGWLKEFVLRVKLFMRLMADKRVNPFLKLIPALSLAYLVLPFDLAPIIPLDDAAILGLGMYLFIEFCPPEVVEEHMNQLRRLPPSAVQPPAESNVIEASFNDAPPAAQLQPEKQAPQAPDEE
ncbi:MAG: hypothetical protein GYA48_10940 [Chloroflexi bacterium]|nr:hypothetical protein [Chloroflexota bacterium]